MSVRLAGLLLVGSSCLLGPCWGQVQVQVADVQPPAYSLSRLPQPDYDTLAPAREVGAAWLDPVFGLKITRMTVAPLPPRTAAEVTNSEINYFNADDTLFFAGDELGKGALYDARTGAKVRQLQGVSMRPWWIRWSPDPKRFYQYEGNELRLFDVDSLRHEVIHKFAEYDEIGPAGGEGDVSDDGRYWCLNGGGKLFVYDLIARSKGPESPFPWDAVKIDYATVTCSGKYVVVLWRAPGTGRYQGTELYDSQWNFQRQLMPYCAHMELAYNPDGEEILVAAAAFKADEFCKRGNVKPGDIISVRLSDGKITLLLSMPKWTHQMYSAGNILADRRYIYMSTDSRGYNPAETWFPYYGEIIEIPTDGSQKTRRLLHHRSRPLPGASPKACQPDFCVNRHGTKIIFKSNVGQAVTDLYMVDVPERVGPNSPSRQ